MIKIDSSSVAGSGQQPAYPVTGTHSTGATLRDWFAVAALQGISAKGLEVNANRAMSQDERDLEMATRAYQLADAMLAIRLRTASEKQ
jgi:hypothetical protein